MNREVLKMALEALENSVDLVRHEYEDAVHLYANYPARAGKISGLLAILRAHENSITVIKEVLAQPEPEPVAVTGGGKTYQDLEFLPNAPQLENGTLLYISPPKRQPLKRATIADARDYLNTNDKAMWVIGWNECVETHEIGEKT